MSKAGTTERKASAAEVRAHAEEVRRLADEGGVDNPRLKDDGTIVVHSAKPGYREVVELSRRLSELLGSYVHVITDDVPAAVDAQPV